MIATNYLLVLLSVIGFLVGCSTPREIYVNLHFLCNPETMGEAVYGDPRLSKNLRMYGFAPASKCTYTVNGVRLVTLDKGDIGTMRVPAGKFVISIDADYFPPDLTRVLRQKGEEFEFSPGSNMTISFQRHMVRATAERLGYMIEDVVTKTHTSQGEISVYKSNHRVVQMQIPN